MREKSNLSWERKVMEREREEFTQWEGGVSLIDQTAPMALRLPVLLAH